MSCDDLTQNIDTSWYGLDDNDSDRNTISKSLDDINSLFSALHKKHKGSIASCSSNIHPQISLEQDHYGL